MGGAAPWASRDLNRVWLPAKQRGQRTLSLLPALGRGRSGLEGQQVEGFCSLWVGGRQKLRNGARPGPPALRACPCICPSLHQPSCRLRTGRWLDPEVSPYPSVSLLVRYELGGSCSCNFQTPRTRSGCDRSIQGTWSLAPLDRLEGGAFGQAPSPDWLRRPSQGASILDLAGGLGGQDVVSAFRARSVLHGPQLGPSVPGPRLSLRHCPPAQQKQRQPSGCSFCLLELSSFMGDSAPPPAGRAPGRLFCPAVQGPEGTRDSARAPRTATHPQCWQSLGPSPTAMPSQSAQTAFLARSHPGICLGRGCRGLVSFPSIYDIHKFVQKKEPGKCGRFVLQINGNEHLCEETGVCPRRGCQGLLSSCLPWPLYGRGRLLFSPGVSLALRSPFWSSPSAAGGEFGLCLPHGFLWVWQASAFIPAQFGFCKSRKRETKPRPLDTHCHSWPQG